MKLFPIHTSNFKIDGGAMFGVVPKVLWSSKYPADENNLCNWALRSLLIDTGERVILIDNGYGDKQSEKFFSHVHLNGGEGLEGALQKYGYSPDDITDMVLTHLHADHCGGGVKYNKDKTGFELTFKNAIYWVSKPHWKWAMNPNKQEGAAFLEENLMPMLHSGHLKFIEKDTELYPGINIRLYNGHTFGQMIPFINTGDKTVVFMADLIPSTAHIPLVWNMAYDVSPMEMLQEKEDFLNEAAENNYILFFQHDIFNECARVQKTDKGVRLKETFTLN
ncbi:MAG: MBL fold metallo-hydrolase [Marinilabiliales bacterium]|nr:MAG: MBL fold metallo-hydrolase [Marinilabiliales bacterium]